MSLEIPVELVQSTNFRYPPKLDFSSSGKLKRIRDSFETDEVMNDGGSSTSGNHIDSQLARSARQEQRQTPQTPFARLSIRSPELRNDYNNVSSSHPEIPRAYTPASRIPAPDGQHALASSSSQHLIPHYYNDRADRSPTSPTISSPWQNPQYSYCDHGQGSAHLNYPHSSMLGRVPLQPTTSMHHHGSWEQNAAPAAALSSSSRALAETAGSQSHPQRAYGRQPVDTLWSSENHRTAGQSSAPPVTPGTTTNFPTVRGRAHTRTRSDPATWSWDHHASPQTQFHPAPQDP